MPDRTLFTSTDVEITTRLARFGSTTFQITNVGSVSVDSTRKMNPVAVALILAGLACFAVAAYLNANIWPNVMTVVLSGPTFLLASHAVQKFWPKRLYTLSCGHRATTPIEWRPKTAII
jgi:hypothetical protein